jgi:hypothetical protein
MTDGASYMIWEMGKFDIDDLFHGWSMKEPALTLRLGVVAVQFFFY